MDKFPIQANHERSFYSAWLHLLHAALSAGMSQPTMVRMLQQAGLKAPTGGPVTLDSVKGTLRHLRQRRGRHFTALLNMVLDNEMSPAQARVLLQRQAA